MEPFPHDRERMVQLGPGSTNGNLDDEVSDDKLTLPAENSQDIRGALPPAIAIAM